VRLQVVKMYSQFSFKETSIGKILPKMRVVVRALFSQTNDRINGGLPT
jgi:hypothetical protein